MTGQELPSPIKILLADDGSQHAQAAIQLLCDLPLPVDTTINAMSVFTPLQTSDHEKLRASLEEARSCLNAQKLNITTELVLGYPAEKLIEFAEKSQPDLIVLGAKGLRSTLGILLGGVAQQVVEYGTWPVLVVRAPYKPVHDILVAVDGSECSRFAVNYLLRFPIPEAAEIHLIHVLPPPPQTDAIIATWPPVPEIIQPPAPLSSEEISQILETEEQQGRLLLEEMAELLRPLGRPLHTVLRRGDAATEIIDYIKQSSVDLILVGSRGLSQVKSWLLGSVSRKLIHYSGCTILVVRAPAQIT